MRHYGRWLLVSLALTASPASAKDLKRLSELIVPAYISMAIAVLCTHDDPGFAAANTSLRGTALHYAEHAKDEAIDGLTYAEAEEVLKGAADVAWAFARRKLREIANPFDREATVRAVKAYCDSDGKATMLRAMIEHDRAHATFVEDVRVAKARLNEGPTGMRIVGLPLVAFRRALVDYASSLVRSADDSPERGSGIA